MKIKVEEEFLKICRKILKMQLNLEEWSMCESDDAFQSEHFEGGFDATEKAFCFSYYEPDGKEFWFQLTLEEIDKLLKGKIKVLEARESE
jgi:hypothetical protein